MKIVSLTAENVKKLRAVEILPNGSLVQITGKNGQGKTSVLDAIWWALDGTKHIQAVPIRKGADKARIRLDLGELIVERRFTEAGSTLIVENAEGARYKSPQAMLDALLGALTFDPLAFVNQDPKKQFDTLRGISKLEIDFDNLSALNRGDFDKRTQINREAKALRAQADGIVVPSDAPAEKIDTAALMDQMASASKVNADIETRKARREQTQREANDKKAEGVRLRDRASKLREEAAEADQQASVVLETAAELEKKIDEEPALPQPVDVDGLRSQLTEAETANRYVDAKERRAGLIVQAQTKEDEAEGLTESMAARDKAKADAIAKAEMPVPGLGFGDGIVTFNNVPFDQASSAEQIKVSVAIAMAGNPKLRVIRIKEGSLLDDDALALIASMAHDNDYQVWIERVDSSGKVGVVIHDGEVVAVDGEPVKAKATRKTTEAKPANPSLL